MSITIILVGITSIVSYICFSNQSLFHQLKHYPYAEKRNKEWYRMISGGFVHGSMMHLLINMFVLWQFGEIVEDRFIHKYGLLYGKLIFTFLYLLIIIMADVPTFFKHKDNPQYASVGASGGTSGIVLIFCLIYPWSWLGLFFIIPIPAIVFAALYLVYSSWASKNSRDMIDHDAHFFGALAGVVLTAFLIPEIFPVFVERLLEGPSWPG